MFDWQGYLTLAAELAARGDDEASQRSAISRAYYCAYHHTTDACRKKDILSPPRHRVWEDLQDLGRQTGRAALADIGDRGADLQRLRIQADYHNPFNRDDHQQRLSVIAHDITAQTQELISLLNRL